MINTSKMTKKVPFLLFPFVIAVRTAFLNLELFALPLVMSHIYVQLSKDVVLKT